MGLPSLYSLWKCFCDLKTRVNELENASSSNIIVDQSQLVTGEFTGDGNADGVLFTMVNRDLEGGWALAGPNGVRLNTAADFIEIEAMAFYDQDVSNQEQRIAPSLEVLMNGNVIQTSATGYQRHTNNHDNSSNTLIRRIKNVPSGALFQIRARNGNDIQDEDVPVTLGTFSVKAVNRVAVKAG